jgi:hypothetical protein
MDILKQILNLLADLQVRVISEIVSTWYLLFVFIIVVVLSWLSDCLQLWILRFLHLLLLLCSLLWLTNINVSFILIFIRVDFLTIIDFNSEVERLVVNLLTLDLAFLSRFSSSSLSSFFFGGVLLSDLCSFLLLLFHHLVFVFTVVFI